ncbi:hypothetical protein J14TS5_07230 [Paenibacillus lautus]|uniref:DUF5946 family protein n=1 Tax=Paenibacillus lautus TaxID=1401 RepID=UPI001B1740AE|nr:DUF5946 family protein [Paenibacillus lautus]GIO95637.1 hypothetical protein J14TS5_07230 [Paenibacillus lautus]
MIDNRTVMESGSCIECGAKGIDGFSCYELFGFPLVWEHRDPALYALHFWLVSCYMLQHPSNYTEEGYPLPNNVRSRKSKFWSMTIEDIYLGGETNAIANIIKWKEQIRCELK